MIFVYTLQNIIGLLIFTIFFIGIIFYGIVKGVKSLNRWRKSGFCRHDWKFNKSNSFSQKHWYKCNKCNEERLM